MNEQNVEIVAAEVTVENAVPVPHVPVTVDRDRELGLELIGTPSGEKIHGNQLEPEELEAHRSRNRARHGALDKAPRTVSPESWDFWSGMTIHLVGNFPDVAGGVVEKFGGYCPFPKLAELVRAHDTIRSTSKRDPKGARKQRTWGYHYFGKRLRGDDSEGWQGLLGAIAKHDGVDIPSSVIETFEEHCHVEEVVGEIVLRGKIGSAKRRIWSLREKEDLTKVRDGIYHGLIDIGVASPEWWQSVVDVILDVNDLRQKVVKRILEACPDKDADRYFRRSAIDRIQGTLNMREENWEEDDGLRMKVLALLMGQGELRLYLTGLAEKLGGLPHEVANEFNLPSGGESVELPDFIKQDVEQRRARGREREVSVPEMLGDGDNGGWKLVNREAGEESDIVTLCRVNDEHISIMKEVPKGADLTPVTPDGESKKSRRSKGKRK